MADAPRSAPFTLRQLPLAAKLVATAFLLSVGMGYASAMVQLHMQHSDRDGTPMPTVANVVAVFAGKRWQAGENDAPREPSKLELLVSGNPNANDLTARNMAPAFFRLDGSDFARRAAERPDKVADLEALREGERQSVVAWINAAPEARRKAYDDDHFPLPKGRIGKPLTPGYRDGPEAAKVRSILRDRCVRCHKPGEEKGDFPLTTYEQLARHMPAAAAVPPEGGWVDSGKRMSLEKLTQSTHAHLLSFAVLFGLTGLTFALSSYPSAARCVLGPLVLAAQVADVSCWWLAREASCGPYFAMCIIGTGGVVGLGLGAQIVLSLFDMYGRAGKAVLLLLFLLAGAGGGLAFTKVVGPFLDLQRQEKNAGNGKVPAPDKPAPANGPSRIGRLLTGSHPGAKWGGGEGGMVQAFFDKDDEFKKADAGERAKLTPEREGERRALLAWAGAPPEARKAAYDADAFAAPDAGHPLTDEFRGEAGAVKVRSLVEARCVRCHGEGGAKDDIPLDKFDLLMKYLVPTAAGEPPIPMAGN